MVRSSFRVVNADDNELLASVIRTAEVESVRLKFSHDNQIFIHNDLKAEGNQRLEIWIPEEGEDFEVTVYDVMESLDGVLADTFDITSFCTAIVGAPAFVLDDDYAEILEGVIASSGVTAQFEGNVTAYSKAAFKYVISGAKGFLSIPIVGDNIIVQQTEGSRDVNLRLINEGDNV